MPRQRAKQTEQGKTWITAVVSIDTYNYLLKLKGDRSWPKFFNEIQEDFRKRNEENQSLRDRVSDLENIIKGMRG